MSNITKLESKLQIVAKFWLKKHFGLETIKTSFAFKSDKRHYQIDLYGSRRDGRTPHITLPLTASIARSGNRIL